MKKANDMEQMRTVYYIVAPTSSGKTTSARRLSKEMGLPLVHADHAYTFISKLLDLRQEDYGRIYDYLLWEKPEEFGLESWLGHDHLDALKSHAYSNLLNSLEGDFIIEGFTLSFSSEREIIKDIIGHHRSVVIRILTSFDEWCELYILKNGDQDVVRREKTFKRLTNCFDAKHDDSVITFSHPREVALGRIASALKELHF